MYGGREELDDVDVGVDELLAEAEEEMVHGCFAGAVIRAAEHGDEGEA